MSREALIRTAAGVIRAAREAGLETSEDLAAALADCCLLQSPETAAEREQGDAR